MSTSFSEIAQFMDSVDPPRSLRDLASRHRWLDGRAPISFSMSTISDRHTNPSTVKVRFLSYNTYLMRVEYDVVKLINEAFDLETVLDCFGLDEMAAVLKALDKFGSDAFCELLPSPAEEICKGLSSGLGVVEEVLKRFPAHTILKKLGVTPVPLLSWFGIEINRVFDEKPALVNRARELGIDVVPKYDLVAFCEVWNADLRSELVSHARKFIPSLHSVLGTGPEGQLEAFGNGLLVLSSHPLSEGPKPEFQVQGVTNRGGGNCEDLNKLADADLWARKGMMLTYVDVGLGVLELYSTHMYSGDPLDDDLATLVGGGPKQEERNYIRNEQARNLIEFYNATHHKENVAIIVGDFNINARNSNLYQGLLDQFLAADTPVDDWWHRQRGDVWQPQGDSGGYTNISGHGDSAAAIAERMPKVCPPEAQGCQDPTPDGRPGERIDYLFVERPTKDHRYNLDFTRIRRKSFPRSNPTDGMAYLSDHLGLDVTLVVSPR